MSAHGFLLVAAIGTVPLMTSASPSDAINAFTDHCFTKGMTVAQAQDRMAPEAGGFELEFYDTTLAPAAAITPGTDRRCAVRFSGNHTADAQAAVHAKMATPPVFGTPTALPGTHAARDGTTFIEARALLRGRLAVVHIGYRDGATFITVERLSPDEQ